VLIDHTSPSTRVHNQGCNQRLKNRAITSLVHVERIRPWPHGPRAEDQELISEGASKSVPDQGHMEGTHMTRGPHEGGCALNFSNKWVLKL
jgi:hypothetical protein